MPIAIDISSLKQRVDSYLWRNRSAEIQQLTNALDQHFAAFDRIAVVGGLVRDFARKGRSGFRSDIDLVIDAPRHNIAGLAARLNAEPNRFGGYAAKIGAWKIDFWALEDTWAARFGGVPVRNLEHITRCTFFDWDAIAYDLRARSILCDANYLERLRNGILDLNLAETPSPDGNLLRAIRRLVLWELRPGQALCKFIEEHLTDEGLLRIQRKERHLHSFPVSSMWSDAAVARQALLNGEVGELQLSFDLYKNSFARRHLRCSASVVNTTPNKPKSAKAERLPGL